MHIARTIGSSTRPDPAVVGFVLWSIERGGYHDTQFQVVGVIEEVYVQPSSRRQANRASSRRRAAGVGTALMEAAMDTMRARGVDDFKLQASTENISAIAFYKRLGWRSRQLLMYHSDTKRPPPPSSSVAAGSEHVSWQVTLGVRDGQLDAFRALTDEMVRVAAEEPGTLVYERFMSEDEETIHAVEK